MPFSCIVQSAYSNCLELPKNIDRVKQYHASAQGPWLAGSMIGPKPLAGRLWREEQCIL